MFRQVVVGAALIAGLAACGRGGGAPEAPPGPGAPAKTSFLVFGDSGLPVSEGGQADHIAAAAAKVCQLRGCDFALGAGDNIYEMGASSATDPLFQHAFEEPFAPLDLRFFMALGNHDNARSEFGEGSANSKGDAQVDYHDSAANVSRKWFMPNRYYNVALPNAATPILELFVIDSSPITHYFNDPSPAWSGAALQAYIAEQQVFLQDALAASTAPWKIALAHHPYLSNGDHGNAGNYEADANPDPCLALGTLVSPSCRGADYKAFLEQTICDKADVFFTGHDHNLFWLQPTAACGRTQFILSGAASKQRANNDEARNPAFFQVGGIYGFFWIEIEGNRLTGAAYTVAAGGVPTTVDAAGNPLPAFEMTVTR